MHPSNLSRNKKESNTPANLVNRIKYAATLIKSARKTVVLTGAGISTPSGIPDFRSADSGIWNQFSPMEVASLSVFRINPVKFFTWLRPLATRMYFAEPNPAHLAFAALEKQEFVHTIITQNIDTLHSKAGSSNVLEVHGTLNSLTCSSCYRKFSAGKIIQPYLEFGEMPLCPVCGHILKPDVILFEEQLPYRTWLEAKRISQTCDLMIVAGSSLTVTPVAGLPLMAIEHNANLIIINHAATYLDERAAVTFSGNVTEIVPKIAKEVLTNYG